LTCYADRAGSLRVVGAEISKYKLHLVGVQVRWDGGGTEPASEYTFFYGKGNGNHDLGTDFFMHKEIPLYIPKLFIFCIYSLILEQSSKISLI
jgi:hypothetical protein